MKFNNIILFAGKTKSENIPLGYFSSVALIPLRGKPIIWWQLNNLKNNGIDEIILVLNKSNTKLVDYAENVLSHNFKIKIVLVNNKKCILSSFKSGLKFADLKLPTRIILGDTLITKSISEETDVLFTSKNVGFSNYWCLISKNKYGIIDKFYDKQKDLNTTNKETVVGYYSFSNTKFMFYCARKAELFSKRELSDALNLYKEKINLKARTIDDWYDLGHTNGLIEAKNILFNVRNFNSIQVNTDLGTLTKISTKIQKLEDEAKWYSFLPHELQILTPRLVSFKKDSSSAQLVQELYGYPSLSELFLSGEVNLEDWKSILNKLFKLHKYFEEYKAPKNESALKWLYKEKTWDRVEELKLQNEFWKDILLQENIEINHKIYKNIYSIKDKVNKFTDYISKNSKMTIMHGDYCFSNILFDSSNYSFKFIDPRGGLNEDATIYGDSKYDIAKLRHSVCGFYDFIVNDLFNLKETKNGFEYEILLINDYSKLENTFNDLVRENGFNEQEIKFIEGLLFLSMIPLHKDNFERQKIFYLKSIVLLNEVFEVQKYMEEKEVKGDKIFLNL